MEEDRHETDKSMKENFDESCAGVRSVLRCVQKDIKVQESVHV
jgi:hypothetical protein